MPFWAIFGSIFVNVLDMLVLISRRFGDKSELCRESFVDVSGTFRVGLGDVSGMFRGHFMDVSMTSVNVLGDAS